MPHYRARLQGRADEAFRAGRLRFTGIVTTVASVLAAHEVPSVEHLAVHHVLDADAWARAVAARLIEGHPPA